ncbi:MAG TPA: alpha/beta hydrolase [Acidimicrobiaceae bacterium]|nr:alpha/beta hydrolase [Acidimicrobiaceae bacterium]
MTGEPQPVPVSADSSYEELLDYLNLAEPGYEMLFDALFADLPPVVGVESRTEVVTGVDGNEINLYIHRPADAAAGTAGQAPCILHLHGGGMVILKAAGPAYRRWRDELAALGATVVGVEFRNGGGELGPHPFPAGLNDCASGLHWAHAHRDELGVSKIVVSGESGGGNLTLATALKAKRDGCLEMIDGVYAQCPYISNAYADPPADLLSLTENDGYFLSCEQMAPLARVYDPTGDHDADPLAWPLHAGADDLDGLPPHVISVNELDPLRDEGLAYYRKLVDAGVAVNARTVNGTCHAGEVLLRGALPEAYAASARDLVAFANAC